jgi:hypothetical protein
MFGFNYLFYCTTYCVVSWEMYFLVFLDTGLFFSGGIFTVLFLIRTDSFFLSNVLRFLKLKCYLDPICHLNDRNLFFLLSLILKIAVFLFCQNTLRSLHYYSNFVVVLEYIYNVCNYVCIPAIFTDNIFKTISILPYPIIS